MAKSKTRPNPFVFVLMPFTKDFGNVYQFGIKAACDNAGAYAERVDEQFFEGSILQRIYNQIDKADVIVSDMTGRNPNVFYETGYAHALGKHVILLTQNSEDIPFDLKLYTHIPYDKDRIAELIPELEKRVKWAIEHAGDTSVQLEPETEFYIGGTSLSDNPTIAYLVPKGTENTDIWLKIDAHNSDERSIRIVQFKLAFLTSDSLDYSTSAGMHGPSNDVISAPGGGYVHVLPQEYTMLPGEWKSISVRFGPRHGKVVRIGDEQEITLRVLSGQGGHDYPFTVQVKTKDSK